jgi:hypothetical protein
MWVPFLLIGALLALLAAPATAQTGFERRGGDYQSFKVPNGDPAACAARCERESKCRAWNFSFPRTVNVAAICSLKNQVPPRVENLCCVSGVRGAGVIEPRRSGVEFFIDRLGGDYRYFDVPLETGEASCEAACKTDNRCRAWTYARPGYISVTPRCYLKDKLKPPRHKPCCISGVLR